MMVWNCSYSHHQNALEEAMKLVIFTSSQCSWRRHETDDIHIITLSLKNRETVHIHIIGMLLRRYEIAPIYIITIPVMNQETVDIPIITMPLWIWSISCLDKMTRLYLQTRPSFNFFNRIVTVSTILGAKWICEKWQ